jgi:hypothetical protein
MNPALIKLYCHNSQITSLYLGSNPALETLYALENPNLAHLDIRNVNNVNVTTFNIGNTPNLTCINADGIDLPDISQAMKDSGKTFSEDCGDFVYIPDANFEQSLVDMGIDSDGVVNTSILREDAENSSLTSLNLNNSLFTPIGYGFNNLDIVNVTGKIADLTGIEAFVNLTNLQVSYSDLITVNVSNNVLLQELWITDGILENIDVTSNANLVRLGVNRNNITDPINLSQNGLLEWLFINNNQILNLDITLNTSLTWLDAGYNSGLTLTTDVILGSPSLTSLNLSGTGLSNYVGASYPNVQWLLLNENNLNKFNGNNALLVENLFLNNNSIDKLVLSSNTSLKQLHAENNVLNQLDLRNGNNIAIHTVNVTSNLLTCISVDDPTDVTLPYASWSVDLGTILSANCNAEPEVILIPDTNFEAALALYDTNGMNGNILLSDAEAIVSLNVSNSNILDLTGIEAFVNLISLDVSNNLLDTINLSNNTNLVNADVSSNNLGELMVYSGRILVSLNASNNQITSIDLSSFTNLESLDLSYNLLSELDLRDNTALTTMDVSNNPNLSCIGVIDPNNIPLGWSKDSTANYSINPDCIQPTIVAQPVTIYLDNKGQASVNAFDFDNGSTDNVTTPENLMFEVGQSDFNCSQLGSNQITLIVTDEAGNDSSQLVNIFVEDNIEPSVTGVNDFSHDLNGMTAYTIIPEDLVKSSSDNCSIINFSINQSVFTAPGVYLVTLTATDTSGNESQDTVEITIEDSGSSAELKFKQNLTLTIYPVPFSREINILFSKVVDFNTVEVILFTSLGSNTSITFSEVNGDLVSNSVPTESGIYILQVTISGQTKSVNIVKD